jgi:hypothetical protein
LTACSTESPLAERKLKIVNAMKLTQKLTIKARSRLPAMFTVSGILAFNTFSAFAQGIRSNLAAPTKKRKHHTSCLSVTGLGRSLGHVGR